MRYASIAMMVVMAAGSTGLGDSGSWVFQVRRLDSSVVRSRGADSNILPHLLSVLRNSKEAGRLC